MTLQRYALRTAIIAILLLAGLAVAAGLGLILADDAGHPLFGRPTAYPTTHPTVTARPSAAPSLGALRAAISPIGTPTPGPHAPVQAWSNATPTPAGVYLPLVGACACPPNPTPTPPPPPADPEIHDCTGAITNTHWLTTTFGAVSWSSSPGAYVRRILPCCPGPAARTGGNCPAVLVAHVEDDEGRPLENVTVVLHWPDAPILPLELRACGLDRGVYGPTNLNGDIGFGLGPGAYYWPPAGGPHTIWIPTGQDSPCLFGLGMLAATNHEHLDSGWALDADPKTPAFHDWGYTAGTIVRRELVGGRMLDVVYWPRMSRDLP